MASSIEIPRIISVDDHVVEPPDLWTTRLPEKYRDRGPRVVKWLPFRQTVQTTRTSDTPHVCPGEGSMVGRSTLECARGGKNVLYLRGESACN